MIGKNDLKGGKHRRGYTETRGGCRKRENLSRILEAVFLSFNGQSGNLATLVDYFQLSQAWLSTPFMCRAALVRFAGGRFPQKRDFPLHSLISSIATLCLSLELSPCLLSVLPLLSSRRSRKGLCITLNPHSLVHTPLTPVPPSPLAINVLAGYQTRKAQIRILISLPTHFPKTERDPCGMSRKGNSDDHVICVSQSLLCWAEKAAANVKIRLCLRPEPI